SELYLKYLQRQTKAQNQGEILDRSITQADYESIGGVTQSLTQRADEEYEALVNHDSAYAQIIRHVMLRMVALGGGELARRRVPSSELEYSQQKDGLVKEVIRRFTAARLLVQGKDADGNSYVELAHDALVRGWKKLEWKQEDEEGLLLQRRLTPAAKDWNKQGQVRFLWHNNPRLDLLKKVYLSDNNWLNQVESEFVQRSVRRKNFNTRRNWGVAIAVIIGLGTGLVFSLIGQRDALIGQIQASRQAAEANLQLDQDLEALVESLRAAKTLKTEWLLQLLKPNAKLQNEVKGTLRTIVYTIREINQWKRIEADIIAFNSQGNLMLAKRDKQGNVTLRNLSNNSQMSLKGHEDNGDQILDGIAFSQDGNLLATADKNGKIRLWNLKGEKIKELPNNFSGPFHKLLFSPDSKQLAIVAYSLGGTLNLLYIRTVSLWDISGSKPIEIKPDQDFNYNNVGFNSNNDLVIVHRDRDFLRLSNFETGEQLGEFSGNFEGYLNLSGALPLVFSPDNKKLIMFGSLADLQTKDFIKKEYSEKRIFVTNFSPSGEEIANPKQNGAISIMDREGKLLFELKEHQGRVLKIAFSPNGNQLASTGIDKTIRLWDLTEKLVTVDVKIKPEQIDKVKLSKKEYELRRQSTLDELGEKLFSSHIEDKSGNLIFATSPIKQFHGGGDSLSPDGMLFASGHDDGIRLWNLSGKQLKLLKLNKDESDLKEIDFSADGKLLIATKEDGTVKLWEIEGLDELREKGCNLVRDYLENNPNVQESDRRLCEGVPQLKQVASPISTIPSPNPSTLSNDSPSIYTGNDYTITITGIGKNASYKGCDRKNQCIEIAQASDYQDGRYVWKNGNYQYTMSPLDNGNYQLEVIDPNGTVILNVSVRPNP
ncbi:WD40 repeat domain-containing protein, partial [Dapis sp. BLCC M229]|uniref:WD40 repeat domain-containing protein n=1 Tax=Dapis sp. BLCC M229 TaxID=3400188 RepID=UPI003CFA1799